MFDRITHSCMRPAAWLSPVASFYERGNQRIEIRKYSI